MEQSKDKLREIMVKNWGSIPDCGESLYQSSKYEENIREIIDEICEEFGLYEDRNNLTPEQAVKFLILQRAVDLGRISDFNNELNGDKIDELYDVEYENGNIFDVQNEIREGEIETDIECDDSRYYESISVASQLPNNQWVGWTYFYGGGKYSDPESIEWISKAYFLDCEEKEIVTIQRTLKKLNVQKIRMVIK